MGKAKILKSLSDLVLPGAQAESKALPELTKLVNAEKAQKLLPPASIQLPQGNVLNELSDLHVPKKLPDTQLWRRLFNPDNVVDAEEIVKPVEAIKNTPSMLPLGAPAPVNLKDLADAANFAKNHKALLGTGIGATAIAPSLSTALGNAAGSQTPTELGHIGEQYLARKIHTPIWEELKQSIKDHPYRAGVIGAAGLGTALLPFLLDKKQKEEKQLPTEQPQLAINEYNQ